MLLRTVVALGLLLAALPAAPSEATIATDEMVSCAALGPKHPGSAADRTMGDRIINRFRAGGLTTTTEDFQMPVWREDKSALAIVGGPGSGAKIDAESFAYSGVGRAIGEVVDLGAGMPADYEGKDVRGKIVLVDNGGAYHRTVQVQQVMQRGGVGMLYISSSPKNLIQTGAVRWGQRPPVSIPAMTIGSGDGISLRQKLAQGAVRLDMVVRGERVDTGTRNIIGIRKGTKYPDRYIVVAGHYDSWYSGANDNCSAVGTLLSVVAANARIAPEYTMVYIGWGAEEPGLVGSYTWIWRHQDLVRRTVLNINLEETATATFRGPDPTALPSTTVSMGSTSPAMLALTTAAAVTNVVLPPVVVPIAATRALSGGIIATDIEGFYAQGVQGVSTASASPYYHTTGDLADTINTGDLERVTAYIRDLTRSAQLLPPYAFTSREVPTVKLSAPAKAPPGAAVTVDVTVTSAAGKPISGDRVLMLADQRDNWAVLEGVAESVGGGRYRWTLPAGVSDADLTRIRATTSTSEYLANGFATVDQRKGGLLKRGSTCRSRRIVKLSVPGTVGGDRLLSLRATSGKAPVRVVRLAHGYEVRVDLRRVKAATRVRLAGRTSAGPIQQTRNYRTCAA